MVTKTLSKFLILILLRQFYVSGKGWNRLNSAGDIKEVEVRALFNLIDKDKSGALSLDVRSLLFTYYVLSYFTL